MDTSYRTHTCGALRASDENSTVRLCGWVNAVRNQGGVMFVDLRDRFGVTQVTFRGDKDQTLLDAAEAVRGEWVLQVEGRVILRPDEARNDQLATGDVEVEVTGVEVLSRSQTPPFQIDDHTEVGSEHRLRYRYLDLRRGRMSRNIAGRARIAGAMRRYLEEQGFLDIETPTLIRSTPEGARDYLVPSRVHPGKFYALPQSPQIFKQLLMVAGQDRYYQFARCYRDEDLRADRQPEFTQVDIEASFVNDEDIYALLEPMVVDLIKTWRGHDIPRPFARMTYAEAMEKYASDKPDLRNPLILQTVTDAAAGVDFVPFQNAAKEGGLVKALVGPGGGSLSRKQIEAFDKEAKSMGTPGVAWAKVTDEGPTGPLSRFLKDEGGAAFLEATGAKPGDLLIVSAGAADTVNRVMGALRDRVAETLELVDTSKTSVFWLVDAPLMAWDAEAERFDAVHHPFTAPHPDDVPLLLEAAAQAPGERDVARLAAMRSQSYDLVMDGDEVAGGSIRIHRQDVQAAIFALLAFSPEELEARFGWFVDALQYGTPPHGGIAFGFDRFAANLLGEDAIGDVIAFPKTLNATDLLCGAPAEVDATQVGDLHLALDLPAQDEDAE